MHAWYRIPSNEKDRLCMCYAESLQREDNVVPNVDCPVKLSDRNPFV